MQKFGSVDVPAMVGEIRKHNHDKKVALISFNTGASAVLAGMGAKPDWFDENVTMSVMLSPCVQPEPTLYKNSYTKEAVHWFHEQKIYALNGSPDWEGKLELI